MSEAELKELRRKRGVVKSKLTNFEKFLDKLKDDQSNNELLVELENRLERVNHLLDEFEEIQSRIDSCMTDETFDTNERETFENSFFKLTTRGKTILLINERSVVQNNDGSSVHSSSGSVVAHQATPKLPAIPIPNFSGNVDQWLEFKETFESLVHNNSALADVQKFHFLKRSLQGEPEKMVRLRKMTGENYEIVWKLLCDRYDDKPSLVGLHLDAIILFRNLSKESSSDLRDMLDTLIENLFALEKLEIDIQSWDPIIVHLMTKKLDQATFAKWEETRPKKKLATLDEFKTFLGSRIDSLKNLDKNKTDKKLDYKVENKNKNWQNKSVKSFLNTEGELFCNNCKGKHSIYNCIGFLKLRTYGRYQQAKRMGLCLNCLKTNHISKLCTSEGCKKCSKKHHTLLHYNSLEDEQIRSNVSNEVDGGVSTTEANGNVSVSQTLANGGSPSNSVQVHSVWLEKGEEVPGEVLLATALVQVVDSEGEIHTCRALLDTGSQPNLITSALAKKLKLPELSVNMVLCGVGNDRSSIQGRCVVKIASNRNNFLKIISCLIVPQICGMVPSRNVPTSHLNIPKHIQLADPGYFNSEKVDLLLGIEVFWEILCVGQVRLGSGLPTLQKTKLGWVVVGGVVFGGQRSERVHCNLSLLDIHTQLEKFWSIEELPQNACSLSGEDVECEKLFCGSTKRNVDGKFMVTIPMKNSENLLGDSRKHALDRFYKLEGRLGRNDKLRGMYVKFMKEYESMGHMSESKPTGEVSYYLPHHGVLNESSETTKLRVVFNGSMKTDTGVSLNDLQYIGPKLQEDLFSILLRFRQHSIVVCGDVAKMYRMIWVTPEQRRFQKIFWRLSPLDELKEYELNTVTYGTKSAPYLAIRCLKELGFQHADTNPRASEVILKDFYVDDMLTGAEFTNDTIKLCNEVSKILSSAGMELRKWVSNDPKIPAILNESATKCDPIHFGEKEENKTLGLFWHFTDDVLMYSVDFACEQRRNTKRSILAEVSRIYDPLGLVGPTVILAKILLQQLWQQKLNWDESLPFSVESEWRKLRGEFSLLNCLRIERHAICSNRIGLVDIHGFSDASMVAYGACVYLRSVDRDGVVFVNLLCSKVKVAPLKTQTIPRLELCGALLLANLVSKVKEGLSLEIQKTHYWTDSTVVLGWLSTDANKLNIFVSNRVSQIRELTEGCEWRHVRSEYNPADILSRGVLPSRLIEAENWWSGPDWLKMKEEDWPRLGCEEAIELPEVKIVTSTLAVSCDNRTFQWNKFSCLNRLKRAVTWCFRFVEMVKSKNVKKDIPLDPTELERAMNALIVISQRESFSSEIEELKKGYPLTNKNLQSLSTFLDKTGLIRVGGRLKLADLPMSRKHPILLSAKHRFTELLVEMEHRRLLHCGPQLLLSTIRETFWIVGGRNLVRKITRRCVRCFRAKPIPLEQIMGVLPEERVQPTPPFYVTGTDYAGPFLQKTKYGRGSQTSKCYICLFVCCSTKAVHLDVVTNLTSEAFIACFRRFVARRGKPYKILSDNGSNYVGANRELKDLATFLEKESKNVGTTLGNEGIIWQFMPPNSPNFGGLWEAGVKSCKYHLKRILGNEALTYEDFVTLLTQIEAVLNCRPLTPMSSDPNDFDILTPSHFLIGRKLTSLPDPNLSHIPFNKLSRWQHLQMLHQHFWSRWSKEYLSELQKRSKWTKENKNLPIGQLVLIKEDKIPPLQWRLGRVVETYSGPDGKVRVAKIKTQVGEFKRSISKLCPLPLLP